MTCQHASYVSDPFTLNHSVVIDDLFRGSKRCLGMGPVVQCDVWWGFPAEGFVNQAGTITPLPPQSYSKKNPTTAHATRCHR